MSSASFPKLSRIYKSVMYDFSYKTGFPDLNNTRNLDPSYKTELEFGDCLRMETHIFNRYTGCLKKTWTFFEKVVTPLFMEETFPNFL